MKIAMQVPYGGDIDQTVNEVVALEKAGLDLAFVAELYSFDAVSLMGYLAAKTETVQIGAGILPIYSRTPTLMGMTAAGVDAVSKGRAVIGLGSSGPQVIEGWHGVPFDAPVGRTKEIIDIIRQVVRREKIEHAGRYYQVPLPEDQGTGLGKPLKLINRPVRDEVPVWVASLGPNNVEMTAEKADGWLPIFYMPEKADDVWGASLKSGGDKRDASLGAMDVAAGGMIAFTDKQEEIEMYHNFARPLAALYVGGMGAKGKNFYNTLFSNYGFEDEAEQIQNLYLGGNKDAAAALIPEEFVATTNLIGPEGFVKERLAAYKESGVTYMLVQSVTPDAPKTVETLRRLIDDL